MADAMLDVVSKLQKPDVYSILCSFLYDLKKVPEYSTLSELCYILDISSLMKFLKYFEGQTVTIPTKEEFTECIQLLMLFQYYEVEHKSWKESLKLVGFESSYGKMAHNKLDRLKETMKKYSLGNREYD